MIDQSFSPQNIEAVFDAENKRGTNIEKLFESTFSASLALTAEMKDIRKRIKYATNVSARNELIDTLNSRKELREEVLNDIFEQISINIKSYTPSVGVKIIKSMTCYTLGVSVESYFYSKILQQNLRDTYKVKQQSRYHILKSIIHFVSDNFPKIVIRTDIKKFYESIPQPQLLEKLDTDHLITINTKRGIKRILNSFNSTLTDNSELGLPRGIGISAYLSEIYMKSIDSEIKKIDDLVYYARYVDDIIAIFTPNSGKKTDINHYIENIREIVQNNSGNHLELHSEKTASYDLQNDISPIVAISIDSTTSPVTNNINYKKAINYLGYVIGFKRVTENVDDKKKDTYTSFVDISDHKVLEYKNKIKIVFEHYNKKKGHNPSRSLKLLKSRLAYLVNNTRLSNNKSNVYVGLYYSYPFVSSEAQLKKIDNSLNYYISRTGLSSAEKEILKQFSFKDYYKKKELIKHSFGNKRYYQYNANRADIHNKKNYGVLKFGIKEITSIWK